MTEANMNAIEIINLIAGITSLVLSVVAIWLSLYFYGQSKNTEKDVTSALTGIRIQTDALQKLTGKWMEKLINYSTQSQPVYSETLSTLMAVIQEMPSRLSVSLPNSADSDAVKKEMIVGYIGTYYYASMANVAIQPLVPEEFNILDETHNALKSIVDNSYSDVNTFRELLQGQGAELTNSRAYSFYQRAETDWLPLVRNFDQAYQEKQNALAES
jgi:hypothetical protein